VTLAELEKYRDNAGRVPAASRRDEREHALLTLDGGPSIRKVVALATMRS